MRPAKPHRYAQSLRGTDGNIGALYSIDDLQRYLQSLAAFTSAPESALPGAPVPYPPIFAWLLSPLAGLSPPLAFALWTSVSAAAALTLAWRVVSLFPAERRLLAATLLLVSTPLVFSLWFGQVQIFLALAFGEAFLALRKGRDLTGGLWLSVLIIKPQYLLIAIPLLAWKRRWRTLGGFAAGGLILLGVSVLVAGPASVLAYFGSFVESATAARGTVFTAVAPDVMVNWRALVLAVPLDLSDAVRLALTLILSGLTVIAVLAAWRGPWHPSGPRFAAQVTLLAVGTVLASYHSHVHGALIIAVPLAAYLSGTPGLPGGWIVEAEARMVLAFAIVAPWLWFAVLGRSHTRANTLLAVSLVAGVLLLSNLLLRVNPTSRDAGNPRIGEAPGLAPGP